MGLQGSPEVIVPSLLLVEGLGSPDAEGNACRKGTHEYMKIVDLATGVVPNQVGVPLVGLLSLFLQNILGLVHFAVYKAFGL